MTLTGVLMRWKTVDAADREPIYHARRMGDYGVSPVIATLLLVAITVLLAASVWWAMSSYADGIPPPPDYGSGETYPTHATPKDDTSTPDPYPSPEYREVKESVEPLPGHECNWNPLRDRFNCVMLSTP